MSPAITTLMLTEMRIGELLAIRWKRIDFKAKTITIQQSLTRELSFDAEGKTKKYTDALGATKARTSRWIIRAPNLALTQLREWMRYVAMLKGGLNTLGPEGIIFFSTRAMEMWTYSGFRAGYRHFLERNGFEAEGANLNRFRYTYASVLLDKNRVEAVRPPGCQYGFRHVCACSS